MEQTQAPSRRAVLASLALAPAIAQAEPVLPQVMRFGLTPVFLDSDLALIRDLERYLSAATGVPVELIKRRTYREVTAMLLSGQLDAAWICGYPFVQHRSALALLAVPLHRGSPLYQSYLIAEADSRAKHLGDLRQQSHAFSDPDSNSGFLVTRWLLAQQGDRPEGFFARTFFAHGHRNVIRAVATGLAQSGSVDGYVWEVMADREPHLTAGTRVLAKSDWHGFPPICCLASTRGGVVARALSAALVEMPRSDLGQRILGTLHLDGWVAGDPTWFDGIARMSAAVRSTDP